jgi:hypothetical protein
MVNDIRGNFEGKQYIADAQKSEVPEDLSEIWILWRQVSTAIEGDGLVHYILSQAKVFKRQSC